MEPLRVLLTRRRMFVMMAMLIVVVMLVVIQKRQPEPVERPPPKLHLSRRCLELSGTSAEKYRDLDGKAVHLVYLVWFPGEEYQASAREIVAAQTTDLLNSALLDRPNTTLHVAVSSKGSDDLKWFKQLRIMSRQNVKLFVTNKNLYEFPGIRLVWELGCQDPEGIYFYFHNKGATYGKGRTLLERALFEQTLGKWKEVLSIMASDKTISTIGMVGGPSFQWFNFFWIRGSRFSTLPKPLISTDRWYYEHWVGLWTDQNECKMATGIEVAVFEPLIEPLPDWKNSPPEYSLYHCKRIAVMLAEAGRIGSDPPLLERMINLASEL